MLNKDNLNHLKKVNNNFLYASSATLLALIMITAQLIQNPVVPNGVKAAEISCRTTCKDIPCILNCLVGIVNNKSLSPTPSPTPNNVISPTSTPISPTVSIPIGNRIAPTSTPSSDNCVNGLRDYTIVVSSSCENSWQSKCKILEHFCTNGHEGHHEASVDVPDEDLKRIAEKSCSIQCSSTNPIITQTISPKPTSITMMPEEEMTCDNTISIVPADKKCQSDSDCAVINLNSCWGNINNYVNKNSLPLIKERLLKIKKLNCPTPPPESVAQCAGLRACDPKIEGKCINNECIDIFNCPHNDLLINR